MASGFALGLGFVFTPQGCGGTPSGAAAYGDAEVPESVARQFRACAAEHADHIEPGERSIRFEVKLGSDGRADERKLLDSTLGDEELEDCMARALRSLSVDDLPMRRAENGPRGHATPESRAFVGQTEIAVAACLADPPCLLALTILMGASYITVVLFVDATNSFRPPIISLKQKDSPTMDPAPEGKLYKEGPSPPHPPPPPDCPRNESFIPERTDDARGCIAKSGHLRCYSAKHPPCAGVHTHGKRRYQEIRKGICVSVEKRAVRCDGPFTISGPCGSVPTVDCKTGGLEISGIYNE